MWLAKRMENANPPHKTYYQPSTHVRRQVNFEAKPANATPISVIQEATEEKRCYKCREPWFPRHKKVCKMVHKNQVQALQVGQPKASEIIYIIEESDSEEEEVEPTQKPLKLLISMHALHGKSRSKHTFTLNIMIGNTPTLALVDTGSTTTFMSHACAQQAKCQLSPAKRMKVIVANGEELWTESTAYECGYTIQGTSFVSDFRFLQLQGYDIILGADWIYHHSPVTLDYKKMILQIT